MTCECQAAYIYYRYILEFMHPLRYDLRSVERLPKSCYQAIQIETPSLLRLRLKIIIYRIAGKFCLLLL
jgi:hypothetical protein